MFRWAVPLLVPFVQFEIIEKDQQLGLLICLHEDIPECTRPIITEAVFSVVFKFAHLLMGEDFMSQQLDFCHGSQGDASEYESTLATKILFNSKQNILWVDRKTLDKDLKNGMPQLHQQAATLLQKRLESISTPESLSRQIYHLMHEDEKYRNAKIDVFAELKNTTIRTI